MFLLRSASERIYWCFLENLGCSSRTILAKSDSAMQSRRPTNPGSPEMCVPDPADGHLLDDRGFATANHIYDTNGRLIVGGVLLPPKGGPRQLSTE